MIQEFFGTALSVAPRRIAQQHTPTRYLLDKNEQPEDVNQDMKHKVLQSMLQSNWNRYPAASYTDLEQKVGEYCGLAASQVALGPGSASIITTLLNYFAINRKRIIINLPSYSLFEYHCNTYNIPFEPWLLSDELNFDLFSMPVPDNNSVVIIASPNNPAGNTLEPDALAFLLARYPSTLFIIDGVYCEFAKHDFTPLVNEYDNLIVLRSFSKAFPVAGLRLGYLCANAVTTAAVKKLLLAFSLNDFTLSFAREVLFSSEFLAQSRKSIKAIIAERERMSRFLNVYYPKNVLRIYSSQGNFLLIRVCCPASYRMVMEALTQGGIRVLNTSANVMLENTFRVSIGSVEENDAFVDCLVGALGMSMPLSAPEMDVMVAA